MSEPPDGISATEHLRTLREDVRKARAVWKARGGNDAQQLARIRLIEAEITQQEAELAAETKP